MRLEQQHPIAYAIYLGAVRELGITVTGIDHEQSPLGVCPVIVMMLVMFIKSGVTRIEVYLYPM